MDYAIPTESAHKGWYSRRYLPHFDNPTLIQMITFRLADSLPQEKVIYWKRVLLDKGDRESWHNVEKYLDGGIGSCCLGDTRVARIVQNAFLHFDGERYRLLAWVIMPNHVHVIVEILEGHPLPEIIHSWKSYTARRINQLLGKTGSLWQPDYFDRYIRSEKHLHFAIDYIHTNPVKAKLVSSPTEWPFSSARA